MKLTFSKSVIAICLSTFLPRRLNHLSTTCIAYLNRGRLSPPKRMNFWKHFRGAGPFAYQKIVMHIFLYIQAAFDHELMTKRTNVNVSPEINPQK